MDQTSRIRSPRSIRTGTIGLLLSGALIANLTGPAQAQTALPLRLDCGDLNGHPAPEAGYLLLTETAAPAGVALSPKAVDTVHVASLGTSGQVVVPADVFCVDPDELPRRHLLTSLKLGQGTTLTVGGLPAGAPLRVRLELGALSPWADLVGDVPSFGALTNSSGVTVEAKDGAGASPTWRTLAAGLRCTTGYQSSSHASVLGGIVSLWARVRTDASGQLQLRFSTTTGDPVYLAGVEVHAYEALPLVYHAPPGGGGPFTALHPALGAFAAAMNAGAYDLAEALALAEPDAFRRGVALVHLLGWLDGRRDGPMHLREPARLALSSAKNHPAAAWLLAELEQFGRALDHLDARGYSSAKACPSEGGFGFLNTACAGQVQLVTGYALTNVNAHAALRRLSGLCASTGGATVRGALDAYDAAGLSDTGWEPSPFVFAALKQTGATLIMVNPFLAPSSSDGGAFVQQFKGVFLQGFAGDAFLAQHFPADMELPLLAYVAAQGTHPYQWDLATTQGALTDAQIDASWWGPLVAAPASDPAWTPWIGKQRHARRMVQAVVEDWLAYRLQEHELGGGLGDDVELLLQLFPLYAAQQRPEDRLEIDALEGLAQYVLEGSGEVQDGYFAGGLTDVQHTGEYTNNSFLALRGMLGYTARALQTGFDVGRRLRSPGDPAAAWMAPTNPPFSRWHFKSQWFTSAGPSTDPAHSGDIPLVGRATYPALSVAGRQALGSDHPLVADLRAWAAAWRDDALSTTGGKPKGFFGPVDWPSNAFGDGGQWWKTDAASEGESTTNPVLKLGQAEFVTELLRVAYRTSSETDRWRYLLPAVRMLKSVAAWETSKPGGAAGSEAWADKQYYEGTRFHAAVIRHVADLANDPTLTTADDPDVPGTAPYVDAALLARLDAWAETTSLPSVNLAHRYALLPLQPCGAGVTAKSQAPVDYAYDQAVPYLRAVFPLLTRHVLHTDRVFMNRGNVLGHLVANAGGGLLVEGHPLQPAVRWRMRAPGSDLSVSTNLLRYDGTAWGAFVLNAGAADVDADLLLDDGLQPGRYRLELGPAVKKCDEYPAGTTTTAVTVQKRGAGTPAALVVPPGLSLVKLVREGPPDAPAARRDLALDPPRARLVDVSAEPGHLPKGLVGGTLPEPVLRVVVRAVSAGRDPTLPTQLRLHARVLDAEGLPVEAWPEVLVAIAGVPALAGASGYDLAEHRVVVDVPWQGAAPSLLAQGQRILLRAQVVSDPFDHDLLNDESVRSVDLADLMGGFTKDP